MEAFTRYVKKKNMPIDHALTTIIDQLLSKLSTDQLFPLLDIFKSLIVHKQVSDFYVTDRKCLLTILCCCFY